jgi:hypothetical protein
MPLVVLPGHYDGERVRLDEPYVLKPGARLIVTVLPEDERVDEREAWLHLSQEGLKRAYADEEPEYPASLLKETNPDYEGG